MPMLWLALAISPIAGYTSAILEPLRGGPKQCRAYGAVRPAGLPLCFSWKDFKMQVYLGLKARDKRQAGLRLLLGLR